MLSNTDHRRMLNYFFLTSWLVLLYVTHDTINFSSAWSHGGLTFAFLMTAWMSYCFIYLLPSLLLTRLADWLANRRRSADEPAHRRLAYGTAVLSSGLTTLFFYANAKLYSLYGMFVNGFVVNLIVTPGGIQSLGGSDETTLGFVLIASGIILGQALLLAAVRFGYKAAGSRQLMPKMLFKALLVLFLVFTRRILRKTGRRETCCRCR